MSNQFFLGFPINTEFVKKLDDRLIVEHDLHEIELNGARFLGKVTSPFCSIESLELLEANILSILRKLKPDLEVSLQLIGISDE